MVRRRRYTHLTGGHPVTVLYWGIRLFQASCQNKNESLMRPFLLMSECFFLSLVFLAVRHRCSLAAILDPMIMVHLLWGYHGVALCIHCLVHFISNSADECRHLVPTFLTPQHYRYQAFELSFPFPISSTHRNISSRFTCFALKLCHESTHCSKNMQDFQPYL